jgi:hypothetical protein
MHLLLLVCPFCPDLSSSSHVHAAIRWLLHTAAAAAVIERRTPILRWLLFL